MDANAESINIIVNGRTKCLSTKSLSPNDELAEMTLQVKPPMWWQHLEGAEKLNIHAVSE